jgi:NDP-sugar pyrophosphorylase family protein
MSDIQALILAGGKGTRLRPYTTSFPKPLLPIDDIPILEIVLRQLASHGFRRVAIATGHLGEMIRLFCADGHRWGLELSYYQEESALGTAGAIGLVRDRVAENFLVMNGDILSTFNFSRGLQFHQDAGRIATIGVVPREVKVDFGVLHQNPDGTLSRYEEKPTLRYNVSMGINFFRKEVVTLLHEGESIDIPTLISRVMAAGHTVSCYEPDCYWLDIGRIDDYATANDEFARRRKEFLPK